MPSPEIGLVFAPFPPLIKIPSGPCPAAVPAAPVPEAVPPGTPDFGPSGDIETRAERFPAGIAGGGATGAGVAESAIRVSLPPARLPMSGAETFASTFRVAACGADIGFTGNRGFGAACEDEAMSIAPGCFSRADISGAATFAALSDAGVLGRRDVSSFALSCSFGRSGCNSASSTMLGSAGKILGGCRGVFG